MRKVFISLLMVCLIAPASASIEVRHFDNAQLESRYNHLINTLRCLVCQDENLANSNAELAGQLRDQVYKMVTDGSTDKQIIHYMVSRYGNFVLYDPPFMPTTYLLWIGPFALLIIGVIFMQVTLRRKRKDPTDTDTSNYEKARQLLADEEIKS